MALNERSPLAAFNQGVGRFSAGNPGVSYDNQGRLQYDAASRAAPTTSGVRSNFFWRSSGGAPDSNVRTRWNFLPWNRGETTIPKTTTYATTGLATSPLVTRTRYDDYSVMPGLGYREFMRPGGTRQVTTERRIALPPTKSDQLVVDEMKIYNQHPPWWWLFISLGILLILIGILNIIFCIEMHYYCRFWTGVMLIIFGIIGAIHKGDYYKRQWKSWIYIIFGFFTAAAVYACLNFDLDTFCHQLIEIAQEGSRDPTIDSSQDSYIDEMKYRFTALKISPMVVINSNVETNIWLCFGLDGLTLIILALSFLVISSVCYVIDRYYNSNWVITRKVEPFCAPAIFNPWGQVSLGQAQIFIGMVLNASVHGNKVFLWQSTYAPVWAGIIPMLAGIVAALSLKSCGLRHRCWNIFAIFLEVISAILSIIAIILVVIGMIQNIQTLTQSSTMNFTSFAQRLMLASTFLFLISALACLVNVVYSIAILIRLILCHCCAEDERQRLNVQYIYDDQTEQPMTYVKEERQVYGDGGWERETRPTQFVDSFESPYQIGRDTRTYMVD
jgi:hypothetical protein